MEESKWIFIPYIVGLLCICPQSFEVGILRRVWIVEKWRICKIDESAN